ncbi:MAG: hypothetical protein G01um10143_600 [Parcubacteria group bacterium Gr01-1014_3]|nr:MAG: hypothetical protein G01um10143_600 [Parcubacteria group bacterium Gr01-1014_3]
MIQLNLFSSRSLLYNEYMELDQYFTKSDVANRCLELLYDKLPGIRNKSFIEPSAGNGSFYSILPKSRRIGLDIAPQSPDIKRADFLSWEPKRSSQDKYVIVGNPPFGHRSKLAIDFFNHSADIANTIAFIVPRQFEKYSVHSKLNKDFRLIHSQELAENSFYTPSGKDFAVRCVFQVWTRNETEHENMRILEAPPIVHPDFEMYQYNNTPDALKFFDKDWDFAVPRQGYEDYTRREKHKNRCELNKQWIMFKVKTEQARDRLFNFDFFSLAKKNTMVYGFGKADVVMEYSKRYD